MKKSSLFFTGPGKVELQNRNILMPGPGQLLVEGLCSAISAGSELIVYRGLAPAGLTIDDAIPGMREGVFTFPMQYGYAMVGLVTATGQDISPEWKNRIGFFFHPHESCFLAEFSEMIPIPEGLSPEEAIFLPFMETALNLVMDGRPLIGERVVIFGQGVIGLLTAALVSMHPVSGLLTLEKQALRRSYSIKMGAHLTLAPDNTDMILKHLSSAVDGDQGRLPAGKADLIFELSGSPEALDQAVSLAGFDSRIVIGSWYGRNPVSLQLGSRFHRDRIKLISSQVSTIDPVLSGRWDKKRRIQLAWAMLKKIRPSQCITHRFSLEQAAEAYGILDRSPDKCIQVIFTYKHTQ